MIGKNTTDDMMALHDRRFRSELKMYINQRLYDKRIISEDMYSHAKETLLKKVG